MVPEEKLADNEEEEEDLIEKKRNKSRLRKWHYAKFHQQPLPLTEDEEQVLALSYQRKLFGNYGFASGISPAKLWPSKQEMAMYAEKERVAYPDSVVEMIRMAKEKKREEEEAILKSQETMVRNMAQLEGWKKEVRQRIEKKEKEALAAKEKRERLIEEVRSILGYRIDPKDERFKEALLQKELQEKKEKKAAKKLEKQQRMIQKLLNQSDESKSAQKTPTSDDPDSMMGTSIV